MQQDVDIFGQAGFKRMAVAPIFGRRAAKNRAGERREEKVERLE
jgi:hypothetical protein